MESRRSRKVRRRVRYKLHDTKNLILFAFYPITTWLTCIVFTVIINCILAVIMRNVLKNSVLYDVSYALITGATASLLVSVIMELTNNYKNNTLGWQELPKVIPIIKETLETKKEFLSDDEIESLRSILRDYGNIRYAVKNQISYFFRYNALNHSDEEYLKKLYPQNIVDDMPDWLRRHLASNESEKAIEKITDKVMEDSFLLKYCMEGYDISKECLERESVLEMVKFDDITDDGADEQDCEEVEEEEIDEETFKKKLKNEMDELNNCASHSRYF